MEETVLVFILITSVVITVCHCTIRESMFYQSCICDVDERIANGCSRQVSSGQNLSSCVQLCLGQDTCEGASVDDANVCFLHQECSASPLCKSISSGHKYVSKTCTNCKLGNPLSFPCQPWSEWTGPGDYPRDCGDLFYNGYPSGRQYRLIVDPDHNGLQLIPVICFNSGNELIWILPMMNGGEVDMNRTWEEYRWGFYVDDRHFWLGLESFKHISKHSSHQLMICLTWISSHNETCNSYFVFELSDALTGFQVSFYDRLPYDELSPLTGSNLQDCFAGIKGKPFSTWDKDNDGDNGENCAHRIGSGWWFDGCNTPCNLFGWGVKYRSEKPAEQIMRVAGIDLVQESPYFDKLGFKIVYVRV